MEHTASQSISTHIQFTYCRFLFPARPLLASSCKQTAAAYPQAQSTERWVATKGSKVRKYNSKPLIECSPQISIADSHAGNTI